LTLECRLAFFLKLLQYRNISYMTWSRDREARLANLTLEQPLTSRQQELLTLTPYTYYIVIFMHVNKASIPTIILNSFNTLILIISLTLLFFYRVLYSDRSNNSLAVIIRKGFTRLDGLAVAS